MTRGFFDGSYGGDDAALDAGAALECRICWWVYDPEAGDPVHQIAPGTPFAALPEDWNCPVCAGRRDGFLVLGR